MPRLNVPQDLIRLCEGWQLARTPAGGADSPAELDTLGLEWRGATVPGTVAVSLQHDINLSGRYDADDWWYRTTFAAPLASASGYALCFEGLATLARVWLNGTQILASRNMFLGYRVDVTSLLRDTNVLLIGFSSLEAALKVRRPRPRWKTALVANQNLRWFRTTLLGRVPGWTPPIAPVGPWRPITLECLREFEFTNIDLQTRAQNGTGLVKVHVGIRMLEPHKLEAARLRVGSASYDLAVEGSSGDAALIGDLRLADVVAWWPHTHGVPHLYACGIELRIAGSWREFDVGPIGFKELEFDAGGNAGFVINSIPLFCRGACWTIADFLSLHGDSANLRRTLETARDAGLNMLRVGGTMVYESSEFYRLCDELGILVWQDFMFANMDYPIEDDSFQVEVAEEARYQLGRLQRHVCIAAYCGGSEVAQQAAMLGRTQEQWTNHFFSETLPRACTQRHAGIPYFPSSPWGGALPFHVRTGISHYYGVGAYRRPLSDVKHAGVKFTTETLGFSNVPDPETMLLIAEEGVPPPHHPRWKARIPRDSGPGWDFEDIRDHYVKALFDVDPVQLRSRDMERYHALSRVVTGEVMQSVFREWRKPGNPCGGALVWFFKDLWPGAGWGILDSTGRPKAAFWYLKRTWAARTILLTDEGLDGLDILVINEAAAPLHAQIELGVYQRGRKIAAAPSVDIDLAPREARTVLADGLMGRFIDITGAYRFGPATHDLVHVRLRDRLSGACVGEDFYFPGGLAFPVLHDVKVAARAERDDDGRVHVTLLSPVFLQSVHVACRDFSPSDNYFHMAPGLEKRIVFAPLHAGGSTFKAEMSPLNLAETITARIAG